MFAKVESHIKHVAYYIDLEEDLLKFEVLIKYGQLELTKVSRCYPRPSLFRKYGLKAMQQPGIFCGSKIDVDSESIDKD